MDFMFLIIWFGASSNAMKRHRSPLWHVAFAKLAAMLVLPVPAVPETSIVLPR